MVIEMDDWKKVVQWVAREQAEEKQKERWNGVFVPRGTPTGIVSKLNARLNAALVSSQVSARFAELNVESRQNTPQEFGAYVEGQMQLWSRIVKDANIKLG
jgi:tripartite-type tricarboxylate transporter receptor subunit TctC